jgi:ubiquitin carboxyl-terminal hydrolase 4/11/15
MNLFQDTVGQLHKRACKVFDLVPDEVAVYFDVYIFFFTCKDFFIVIVAIMQVCIWDYYGRTKHSLMDSLDKTLDDSNIQMDQDVSQTFYNN